MRSSHSRMFAVLRYQVVRGMVRLVRLVAHYSRIMVVLVVLQSNTSYQRCVLLVSPQVCSGSGGAGSLTRGGTVPSLR